MEQCRIVKHIDTHTHLQKAGHDPGHRRHRVLKTRLLVWSQLFFSAHTQHRQNSQPVAILTPEHICVGIRMYIYHRIHIYILYVYIHTHTLTHIWPESKSSLECTEIDMDAHINIGANTDTDTEKAHTHFVRTSSWHTHTHTHTHIHTHCDTHKCQEATPGM